MRTNGERLVQQKTNYGFCRPLLTVTELHQLFDLRYVLETHALSLAELPNPLVDELENLVCQLDKVSDGTVYSDFKDYLLIDHSFHRTLVSMSGNSFLLKAWEDLHVHLHLSRLYTGVGLIDRSYSTAEHRQIVNALQIGAMDNARELLANHIRGVEERVSAFLHAQMSS
ncbi:MAG: GntR family transcriptional regulator [Chloroflexi bacterium]|nr:GntR family transcriptional regulator [Chloroflexota bacterium]